MNDSMIQHVAMTRQVRLGWLLALLAVLLALFWPTFTGMVDIWWRSETFAHGFLVLPVTLYLIWRKRVALCQVEFQTDPWALLWLVLSGFVWLIARLTDVLVIEQLAVVAMIVSLVWLALGRPVLRILAFPLGFLLFAVPMGEALVEPLMRLTATFTVTLLRLSGIPVFWEGTFFSIPSGDWSVVAACSGIRYLIASVFLGVLYAYLNYHSIWRRLAFIALATVVPILANGIRAYLIVMIGHLSGMKLAVGIDHLIYGWVFFGIVMFLLFALGNLWSEKGTAPAVDPTGSTGSVSPESARSAHAVLLSGLLLLTFWPAFTAYLERSRFLTDSADFEMPTGQGGWEPLAGRLTDWRPHYLGASAELGQGYQNGSEQVGLYLAFYGNRDGELINSENVMVPQNDPAWQMPYETPVSARIDGKDVTLVESQLQSSGQKLLVWHWYWIDGHAVANDYIAKLYEALALLSGHGARQAGVLLYTPMDLQAQPARERLQRFLDAMLPAIDASLNQPRQSTQSVATQMDGTGRQ